MLDVTFRHPLRLAGRHVELVPLEERHVEALAPALTDWTSVEFLRDPPGPDLATGLAWLRRWVELSRTGPDLSFATTLRATGRPVGVTSFLRLDRPSRGVEIGGTWIDRRFWRTPVNSEAKLLMLQYAFEEAHLHRVQFQTDLRNVRSQTAIAALGATPEVRLREDVRLPTGRFRTSVYFSILEAEWPASRARLARRLEAEWKPPEPWPTLTPTRKPDPTSPSLGRPDAPPLRFHPPVTLEGPRVRLVPLDRSHVPALTLAGAAPEIWTLLRIRHGDTPEGMAGLVEDLLTLQEKGEVLAFTVQLVGDRRVVGIARFLDIDRPNRWVEVGTWLHPDVWRTPVNTELKWLMFQYAFDTEQVHRVQLKTDARNVRSRRAIERLGAVGEGVRRDHYRFPDGTYRTSEYYSVLASEWPSVRGRLETMLRRPWSSSG